MLGRYGVVRLNERSIFNTVNELVCSTVVVSEKIGVSNNKLCLSHRKTSINTYRYHYLDSGHVLGEALVLLADLEGQLAGVAHDQDRDLE